MRATANFQLQRGNAKGATTVLEQLRKSVYYIQLTTAHNLASDLLYMFLWCSLKSMCYFYVYYSWVSLYLGTYVCG